MSIEVITAAELTADLAGAWRSLQSAEPELGSAFLAPGWPVAVSRAVGDRGARIAVALEAGRPTAFLPVRPGRATAVAVGAPLSDGQAVIAAPDAAVDLAGMLRALRVQRFDFTHAPVDRGALSLGVRGVDRAWRADLSDGWTGYAATLKQRKSALVKDVAVRTRRLTADFGEVVLTADSHDAGDLDRLIALKRRQYLDTRQTDVLAPDWTRRLLHQLFEQRDGDFGGRLSTLHVGGRLAAALFSLRAGPHLSAWFIAHDHAFARHSPGVVLLVTLIEALGEEGGWSELDFGSGVAGFKQRLATSSRPVGYGFVGVPSVPTMARSLAYGVRRWAEGAPLGRVSAWPGKAMRRWDVMRTLHV